MEFEFDPAKSASNLEKHGIDFGAVQAIWQDVMRVEIPARKDGKMSHDGWWSARSMVSTGRWR